MTVTCRRVLVTGAGGFVGRSLCPALLEAGWPVVPIGRRETGDIGPETDWRPWLDGAGAVIHLAGRAHLLRDDAADPEAAFDRINHGGTARLAAQAAEAGVERFIFLSSVKVHGDISDRPLCAADTPVPVDAYGRSKLAAERALAGVSSRIATVVLRPPLVYGPGVKANFLALLRAVDHGWPLPLSAVANRRSLIYLGNLIDAIQAALDVAPGIYLPSDRDDVSTPLLIRRIAAALGRPSRLFPVPTGLLHALAAATGKTGAIERLTGSLTVDGKLPGWHPPFTMQDGLSATAAWYRRKRIKG